MQDAPVMGFLRSHATLARMVGIATLGVLLLVPLGLVDAVLEERLERRDAALAEITRSWGGEQEVFGPILAVPFTAGADRGYYFLPEHLTIQADLRPETRRRGIYQTVVYRGTITLEGSFAPPDLEGVDLYGPAADIAWNQAWLAIALPDLRGVEGPLELAWGQAKLPLRPGTGLSHSRTGLSTRVTAPSTAPIPFRVTITLNGSRGIRFVPIGADTRVVVRSAWPSPSFQGSLLPVRRSLSAAGFEAEWRASEYASEWGHAWNNEPARAQIAPLAFGVDLIVPIDAYRNVERAIKYGVLFIALVFVVFFLFETRARVRIHPFQYTLVGLAVALFFLLLLAVSELVAFPAAYAAAAGGCTLMISLYSLSVLGTQRRTLIAAGGLAAAFGFLYVTLQLEDYALLVGATGLAAALAIIMFVTRRIDWYARDAGVDA